jgi:hypothetical protein
MKFKMGDTVYESDNPRHLGTVVALVDGRYKVKWLTNGFFSLLFGDDLVKYEGD